VKRAIAVAVLALFVAPALAGEPAPSHFKFKIPAGWKDKSGTGREYFTLAVDEEHRLAFQGKVAPGGELVTPELLDKYAADAQKSVARLTQGAAELKVIQKSSVVLDGVTAARFVFELPPPPSAESPQATRQLQFYVPVGDQHAVLTFTAPVGSYDKFEPLFEKTARALVIRK
jgi:hypothetical protein